MTRAELHALIDRIPEDGLEAVEQAAREALIAAIPEEEEEVSPEEAAAIDEAWESYRREGGVPDHLVDWEGMDRAQAR